MISIDGCCAFITSSLAGFIDCQCDFSGFDIVGSLSCSNHHADQFICMNELRPCFRFIILALALPMTAATTTATTGSLFLCFPVDIDDVRNIVTDFNLCCSGINQIDIKGDDFLLDMFPGFSDLNNCRIMQTKRNIIVAKPIQIRTGSADVDLRNTGLLQCFPRFLQKDIRISDIRVLIIPESWSAIPAIYCSHFRPFKICVLSPKE